MSPPIKKNLELDSTLMMICSPSGNLRMKDLKGLLHTLLIKFGLLKIFTL